MDVSPRLVSLVLALAGAPLLAACEGAKDGPSDEVEDTDQLVDSDSLRDTAPDSEVIDTEVVDTDTDLPDTDTDVVVDTDTDLGVCDPSLATTTTVCLSYFSDTTPCPDAATAFVGVEPNCLLPDYDVVPGCEVAFDQRIVSQDTGGPWSSGDQCCYTGPLVYVSGPSCAIGRPLRVRGRATVPGVRAGRRASRPRASDRLIAAWTTTARLEQSAVPAFARAERLLRAWGAPDELVTATARARADEERHAAAAFRLASRFAGRELVPEPLLDPGDVPTPVAFALETLRDAAVGEAVAVAQAAVAWRMSTDAEVRAFLADVVREEAEHATLGLRTVAWMAQRWPEVAAAVRDALAEVAAEASALPPHGDGDPALAAHGLPDEASLVDASVRARALAVELVEAALAA